MAFGDILKAFNQSGGQPGAMQPMQSPIGMPPVGSADKKAKNERLALMLYALGGALGGKDIGESAMAFQQIQAQRQAQEQGKRQQEAASNYLKSIGASEEQQDLVKGNPDLASQVLTQSFNTGKQTALIENANFLSDLRKSYEIETDPIKKRQTLQKIRDVESLGSALKYDTTKKYEMTQAELAAEQGLDLGERPLGAGELKTDQTFGTFYSDYITKGRGATNIANLERLRSAEAILKIADKEGVAISGVTAGMIRGNPSLEAFLNEQGFIARETVESVIQQSLRATLGAQFGEKEGEQFIRRGYNPSLPPAENLERLIDLRANIEQLVDSEREAVEYWENNKTLRGYKGKQYNMDSFSRDLATDYKQEAVGLSDEELIEAYSKALEDSIWESSLEKEITRRNRLQK